MRGGNPATAIEMGQPPVAMPPHAGYSSHTGDHLTKIGAVDASCRGGDAQFDKLAHKGDVLVRHAAGMATHIRVHGPMNSGWSAI